MKLDWKTLLLFALVAFVSLAGWLSGYDHIAMYGTTIAAVIGVAFCWASMDLAHQRCDEWKLAESRKWAAMLREFQQAEIRRASENVDLAALGVRVADAEARVAALIRAVEELHDELNTTRAVALRRGLRPQPPPLEEGILP